MIRRISLLTIYDDVFWRIFFSQNPLAEIYAHFCRVHQEALQRELGLRPIMVLQQQDWGNQADYDLHLPILEAPGSHVLWQVYLGPGLDCRPLVEYPNPTQTQVVELQVHQDQGKIRITKYWRHTVCKIKNFSLPLFFYVKSIFAI